MNLKGGLFVEETLHKAIPEHRENFGQTTWRYPMKCNENTQNTQYVSQKLQFVTPENPKLSQPQGNQNGQSKTSRRPLKLQYFLSIATPQMFYKNSDAVIFQHQAI